MIMMRLIASFDSKKLASSFRILMIPESDRKVLLQPSYATVPTLYSFRRGPYGNASRMAIAYAGIDGNGLREVELKDKPAAMLLEASSRKGISHPAVVPVLIETNGRVIDESLDVMAWALDQQDSTSLVEG